MEGHSCLKHNVLLDAQLEAQYIGEQHSSSVMNCGHPTSMRGWNHHEAMPGLRGVECASAFFTTDNRGDGGSASVLSDEGQSPYATLEIQEAGGLQEC